MVSAKYTLITLLAATAMAAPAATADDAVVAAAAPVDSNVAYALEERNLLPLQELLAAIKDCTLGVTGVVGVLGNLAVKGKIESTVVALAAVEKAVVGLTTSVPALIKAITDCPLFNGIIGAVCAPGISIIIHLVTQAVTSILGIVGQLITKSITADELKRLAGILHSCRDLVDGLSTCVTSSIGNVEVGSGKMASHLLPKLESAVSSIKSCQNDKVCNGW